MKHVILGFAAASTLIFSPISALAAEEGPRELAVDLGSPFHDRAILQREMAVPVWGWSKPGTQVTVEFAGQKKSATAGEDGKWMLKLDPLKANAEPAEMLIQEEGGKSETLRDILVGEVWMASGQSNMQWLANKSVVGRQLIPGILKRVEEGKEPMPVIREGKIDGFVVSLTPQDRGPAQWSSDWQNFSAIAFAFAYDLAKELQVPIGIVNCSFSSTQIQAWTPREGFSAGTDEYTKEISRRIVEGDPQSPEHKAAWEAYYQQLVDWGKESAERVAKGLPAEAVPTVPGNLRGDRDACWLYNGKMHPMVPYAIRGAIWNQGYANQNDGILYRNNLHSLIRGWRTVWDKPELPVYFHQFYCPKGFDDGLILKDTAEMRLGTWLAAKEIPHSGMASQIDITGGVHYYHKAVPGQRLARHALKNQYGRDIIANGPSYKGYKVEGGKLTLELDHADGLLIGQNAPGNDGLANPVAVTDAECSLFYLADKERAWHRAQVEIKDDRIILSTPGLQAPCGVAYAGNGVGTLVGIYNKAMLPMTPFIIYENELVTTDNWPMDHLKLAGETVDPKSYGLQYEHRKLPLLSPQFREHGVIQADVPIRIHGKALPKSVVKFAFAGVEKSIALGENETHWEVTVPAMPASKESKTLHVTCTLDGELAHERTITGIVTGDVWYVALNDPQMPRVKGWPNPEPPTGDLRMLTAFASKRTHPVPDRYKLSSSGTVESRFYSRWANAEGLSKALGEKIHAKTGKPVGIIIMETRNDVPLKGWVGYEWLKQVPAWKADADELHRRYAPDPAVFAANAATYSKDWQDYWNSIRSDPAFKSGTLPRFPSAKAVKTPATMTYNMLIAAFNPASFKGVICLTPESFIGDDQGAGFGAGFSVMANCWKETFAAGESPLDPLFIYTVPGKGLAAKITKPTVIEGNSTAYEMNEWLAVGYDNETRQSVVGDELDKFLDAAVKAVYR